MLVPSSLWQWAVLPRRVALLLGISATSAVAAPAAAPGAVPADSADAIRHDKPAAEAAIVRLCQGRIELSENGAGFTELRLGDTPAAQHLRQLLERAGTDGIRLSPTILAGSGGTGFHWTPADKGDGGTRSGAAPSQQKG